MDYFGLPETTKVLRVIPKNSFDKITNTKQKKALADKVQKITWLNKLSKETINLEHKEIEEIQVFEVRMKIKDRIESLLDIIDKSIPYHIIFVVRYNDFKFFRACKKHIHPTSENVSVLDWVFTSDWMASNDDHYELILKKNIDSIFEEFCFQLSGEKRKRNQSLDAAIERLKKRDKLLKEISKLKSSIAKGTQFNRIVELNVELKMKEKELTKV